MKHTIGTGLWRRAIPAALAVGLVAGACSANTSTDAGGDTGSTSEDGGTKGPRPPVTLASDGTPKPGGTLRYALEAETTGFKPTSDRWSIVGVMMGLAVYDTMVARYEDGSPAPYLAESFESSDDFKTWTFTMRDGVMFHDGTPLTAEAVANVYNLHLKSPLTGAAITNVESVTATGPLTVVFTMKEPWAAFPGVLTGQLGVIPSPGTLADEQGGLKPVGTGPFQFVSWEPDKEFEASKYDGYWQKDAEGNALPDLDTVIFQPTPENTQRLAGLKSGDFEMIHTTDQATILEMRDLAAQGQIQLVEDQGEAEEGFVMLNTSKPPFDDIRARQAVAYATNNEEYNSIVNYDVNFVANGPFTPDSPWYLEDNGYPEYDPAKAQELVNEIKAEKGEFAFTLRGGGVDTRDNLEFLQQQWEAVGMEVELNTDQQNTFITDAVAGNYEANLWRQFGAPDPDADYLWWTSDNATGGLALNIARNQNPEIDAALDKGRSSTDPAEREAAYDELQRLFSQDLPYIWLDHSVWAIGANNKVRQITNGPLPDGKAAYPVGGLGFPGVTFLTQTWLDQ
ncbi:MAG: ABC transporter substrate-binding protein [Acidimicrobiales bacterium]